MDNKKVGQGKISYPNKSYYEGGGWACARTPQAAVAAHAHPRAATRPRRTAARTRVHTRARAPTCARAGEWADDMMQGAGLYVYGNGDMYKGAFLAGKRHGHGSYHFKAMCCQLVGEWVAGGFVRGKWVMKDGSMFYGTFEKEVSPVSGGGRGGGRVVLCVCMHVLLGMLRTCAEHQQPRWRGHHAGRGRVLLQHQQPAAEGQVQGREVDSRPGPAARQGEPARS